VSFAEPRFRLSEHRIDDHTTIVAVRGEIHVSTAQEFSRLLAETVDAGRIMLVLDLSDVEFIDSTGLSVLLNALRRVTRAGGRMALVCTNPTVLRLFEITRLDSTFAIHADARTALAQVQPADGRTPGAP
jgi:anti-sigma B factor antagonist